MKKIKYYYNTQTLRYEKQVIPLRVTLLRILAFLSTAVVSGLIIVAIAFKFLDSPKEKILKAQLDKSEETNRLYVQKITELDEKMKELEKRDNDIYRSVFEAQPIPDSARAQKMENKQKMQILAGMNNSEMTSGIYTLLTSLRNRIQTQETSYKEIEQMVKDKEKLLACTPAIQPINNKDLIRLSSGFGQRIDPIYKTVKQHAGLDFSAPQGTPIYATADGVVETATNSGNGYGNHVIINHGFSYKTLYGHMVKLKAVSGNTVKRGEVIGYVGSTGKSTGPHLHYEVIKGNVKIDPIYFFYNDLTPQQYERILKIAASKNQSFD
jgi:murein DD-endopeptidase MepM/ murein hydrolase activator NlpD